MSSIALVLLFIFAPNAFAENVPITKELVARLKATVPVNFPEIVDELNLERRPNNRSPASFSLPNPYYPHLVKELEDSDHPVRVKGQSDYTRLLDGRVSFHHQTAVHQWGKLTSQAERDKIVCGVQFLDVEKNAYRMKTFDSKEAALFSGYIVTHQYACGACSSLQDLAVFLEVRDMTTPGRKCARKRNLEEMKKCNRDLGLTHECSEAWAYNTQHTKETCLSVCVKDYGLLNVIRGQYPGANVGEDGILRPCLLCDELKSGLAYKYSTGRTRRSSGIESDIPRPGTDLYPIDYLTYYREFGLEPH